MARVSKPRRRVQLELPLERPPEHGRRGGFREGAGRKPEAGRRAVRHRAREAHSARHPVHVVLRSKFKPLRSQFVFPALRKALALATRARKDFRITQFSVQGDHVHLIVEAGSKPALSRGMQGLAIRIARAVNALVNRSGKVWADRFFSRELKSPRVVRNALAYVLNNFRKHRALGGAKIDPYSSAPYFSGFRELRGRAPCELQATRELPLAPRGVAPPAKSEDLPVVGPRTWLAEKGWRRSGLLSLAHSPGDPPARAPGWPRAGTTLDGNAETLAAVAKPAHQLRLPRSSRGRQTVPGNAHADEDRREARTAARSLREHSSSDENCREAYTPTNTAAKLLGRTKVA